MSTTRSGLAAEWLDRAWTLTWASIALASALLVGGYIKAATWLQVFTLCSAGFFGLRLVDAIGVAVKTSREADGR